MWWSKFMSVHKGVPQGSIVVPFLFILYINELGQKASDANVRLYADEKKIVVLN